MANETARKYAKEYTGSAFIIGSIAFVAVATIAGLDVFLAEGHTLDLPEITVDFGVGALAVTSLFFAVLSSKSRSEAKWHSDRI